MSNTLSVPTPAPLCAISSMEGRPPARRSRKRVLPPVAVPAPAPPVDRAAEAAFFIGQLQGEIARQVLPALLQETATGNASWRNTRWLLQLAGDDQGRLSIPRLTALPVAHPLA